MRTYTTRSGRVLHGSPACPGLARAGRVFVVEEEDALAAARRCESGRCQVAFLRQPARVAA